MATIISCSVEKCLTFFSFENLHLNKFPCALHQHCKSINTSYSSCSDFWMLMSSGGAADLLLLFPQINHLSLPPAQTTREDADSEKWPCTLMQVQDAARVICHLLPFPYF